MDEGKKQTKKNVIKYSELGFEAGCVLLVRSHLPLFFWFCQFPSFDVYLWVPASLLRAHTIPPPSSFVFVLLCLVSIRSQRVKGWGPRSPWGQPEAPRISREALDGASRLRSAPLIADFPSPFEICVLTCSMCSYAQTTTFVLCLACHCIVCRRLGFLPLVVMIILCFLVCLLLYISGKRLQVHIEPGARWTTLPMCLCVVAESQSGMSF